MLFLQVVGNQRYGLDGIPLHIAASKTLEARKARDSTTSLYFLINYDYKVIGGAMTRFRQELEYFSSKGYPVTVIYSSSGREKHFRKDGVSYYNIRHIRHELVLFQLRVLLKCLRHHVSKKRLVFIAHNPISSIPPSLLRLAGLNPKTVLVMHGPSAVELYFRGSKPKAALQSVIDRIAFTLATKIVAVSEYERDYAIRLKTKPRKIVVIRNGIELPRLTNSSSFREEMKIPLDSITIGYIGSIAAYRGVEFLIKALSIAKAITKVPLALVLVFREELSDEQKAKIKELAGTCQDSVYISRPRKNISPVLSTLDIYASHFSRKVEGIGFSIMEAMGSGLPVVTGKDNITNGLLKDSFDAILVDKENPEQIAQAIKELAEDTRLRRKLGASARNTAITEFSNSHMLDMCEREYLNVVRH